MADADTIKTPEWFAAAQVTLRDALAAAPEGVVITGLTLDVLGVQVTYQLTGDVATIEVPSVWQATVYPSWFPPVEPAAGGAGRVDR